MSTVDGVTAQEVYRVLLRDHVGPALRGIGYKGSAGHFHKKVDDYVVAIGFQKNKWSDCEHVDYRINLRVVHPATAEKFDAANTAAREIDREWQYAPAGNWFATFPGPMMPMSGRFLKPEAFFGMRSCDPLEAWITLHPNDDLSSHADLLMDDLRLCVFPEIEAQLQVGLEEPEPVAGRPQRGDDAWADKRRLEYKSTLKRLQTAGIPTERGDAGVRIYRHI
jgi:Domain of unknown function (DUF4304)